MLAAASSACVAVPQNAPSASLLSAPAHSWAVDCANDEVLVIEHPESYLRYRMHVVDDKGDQVRDQIETPDGTVARLLRRDGRALTPQEDSAERDRLNSLLAAPATFTRRVRHDQENRRMGVELLKMMPDAMLWSYTPGQPQLANLLPGDTLVVIDFKPNPKWSPPNFESDLLTGIEGRAWIDPHSRRLVHLEANVFHPVNVGWGIVARIYPGGTVSLHQTNAGGRRWIVEHVVEQLNLRALMVKNIQQRFVFDTSDFQQVPPMSYQQAIGILLDAPLPNH